MIGTVFEMNGEYFVRYQDIYRGDNRVEYVDKVLPVSSPVTNIDEIRDKEVGFGIVEGRAHIMSGVVPPPDSMRLMTEKDFKQAIIDAVLAGFHSAPTDKYAPDYYKEKYLKR
jgi:hypothetical protein